MHLAYIISQYPAVSHTFVQREILGLRKLGFTITTISIRPPKKSDLLTPTDQSEADQTHVILPPNPLNLLAAILVPLFTAPLRFLRAWRTASKLRRPGLKGALWSIFYFLEALLVHRLLRKTDIIHLHAHFANVASDVAMIAAPLAKTPRTFSFTMHGPTEFFDLAQHRLAEKTRAARFVICISDFARSQLMPLIPADQWSKLRIVHCGVDPAQFHDPRTSPLTRSPVHTPQSSNLLTVARLAPVKAHPILFQALDELTLRGYDIQLTLVGDGPCRKQLEQLADAMNLASRIRFLGNIGQDRIHQLYADADLFVLPSIAEGVPVVLMEAMAAHCPVIATRIAGIPELIDHDTTGLLVTPGRPDLLADAIERLLLSPRTARRLAHAAHEKIFRDFNLNLLTHQLATIFAQHLQPARQSTPIDARTRARDLVSTETLTRPDAMPNGAEIPLGMPHNKRSPTRESLK